ncbi:MAG: type 4a pilus biogenesis protein PilO [Candidatus Rokubacteria bacterium]|nr:type 4a pilus biogenesis protein PilO [Candidatus Rokubacteria bacterium]
MIGNLSRRERLLVGGGILLAVVVLGWEGFVQPLLDRDRLAEETVPVREQLLQRRQALVARRATIAKELETTNERITEMSKRFLTAATPAVAASELQNLVKSVAAEVKTEIRSERILPTAERGELLEIPIEIAVSGEIRELVELLSRLEKTPKMLAIQDLRIRVVNVSQPKDLLATITLSGFILPSKAKA